MVGDYMTFQIGSALLDACVLAIVYKEDTYGYKLTQEVKSVMSVSESTLYPVLRRLLRDGYVKTYDQEHLGRNRRYYCLSDTGRKRYTEYCQEWTLFSSKIDTLLKGGMSHE